MEMTISAAMIASTHPTLECRVPNLCCQITNEYHVQTRNGTKDPLAMCLSFFSFLFLHMLI